MLFRSLPECTQPLTGWWGHAKPFAMSHDYVPLAGIGQYLVGTQPIVSMALVECGLDIARQVSMDAVRTKSLALTDAFIAWTETECAALGLTLVTPRKHAERGSQVSFAHENAYEIMQALIERGVIGDFRAPDILRFGFTPLYVGFVDAWNAVQILKEILQTEVWREARFAVRGAVT